MLPSQCENAADTVFSTPHSCLTTPCPTHCSPTHANLCPMRMHRLILGLTRPDKSLTPLVRCPTFVRALPCTGLQIKLAASHGSECQFVNPTPYALSTLHPPCPTLYALPYTLCPALHPMPYTLPYTLCPALHPALHPMPCPSSHPTPLTRAHTSAVRVRVCVCVCAPQVASVITPVPGGVGPMTIAAVLHNTIKAARFNAGLDKWRRG